MAHRTRHTLIFLALAFAPAWISWEIMIRTGWIPGEPGFQPLVLVGAFCPALAALVVRLTVLPEKFTGAGLRPRFRSWKWYLLAWLLPLPATALICLVAMVLNLGTPDWSMRSGFELLASATGAETQDAPAWITILTMTGSALPATLLLFGEEFGWRGFLQGRLAPGRPLLDATLTGVVWSAWHLPLNLRGYNFPDHPMAGIPVFTVSCVILSVIFGWLKQAGGSVWIPSLAHSAVNFMGASFTLLLFGAEKNPLFLSYLGILGWIPLGGLAVWIAATKRPLPGLLDVRP